VKCRRPCGGGCSTCQRDKALQALQAKAPPPAQDAPSQKLSPQRARYLKARMMRLVKEGLFWVTPDGKGLMLTPLGRHALRVTPPSPHEVELLYGRRGNDR